MGQPNPGTISGLNRIAHSVNVFCTQVVSVVFAAMLLLLLTLLMIQSFTSDRCWQRALDDVTIT